MNKRGRLISAFLFVAIILNIFIAPVGSYALALESDIDRYHLELADKRSVSRGLFEEQLLVHDPTNDVIYEGFSLNLLPGGDTNIMFASALVEGNRVNDFESLIDYYANDDDRHLVASLRFSLEDNFGSLITENQNLEDDALYLGVLGSGFALIGNAREYAAQKEELIFALLAKDWIILEGNLNENASKTHEGTIAGIKDDGTLFFLTFEEDLPNVYSLADVLADFGARNAIYLGERFDYQLIENSQASLIDESIGQVGDGVLLFYYQRDLEPEIPDEYIIVPDHQAFEINSQIQFSIDSEVDAMEEMSWRIDEVELGNICDSGLFSSNGLPGELNIHLINAAGKIKGSAKVFLIDPEQEHLSEESEDGDNDTSLELELNGGTNGKPAEQEWLNDEGLENGGNDSSPETELDNGTNAKLLVNQHNPFSADSEFTPPSGNFVVSRKQTAIVPGVVETEYIYNNVQGSNPVSNFIVDIELSNNTAIMAASKDYNKPGTQNVREMARAAQIKTGRNIVAAINADLNWSGTGLSNGPLIIDGHVYSDKADVFFGIFKNGEAIIGDAAKFREVKDDLEQAIRGMGWLVKDGEIATSATGLAPRTAVGLKADGTVFFHVVEGRNFPRSVGISVADLAQIMRDYGAVWALNLDGGGSTTYFVKTEGKTDLELRNIPSDGVERPSISSLLVYSNVGDGIFHHAKIDSESDLYTPGSKVVFTATGVDKAGGAAELPENLVWAVLDEALGEIDADGCFVSSGEEGEVIIQLRNPSDEIVGEGRIEILTPDDIHFLNEEFSLGFNEQTDFGLRLTHEQRLVSYKDGDVIWEFIYDEAEYEEIGSMQNNVFTSNPGVTALGTIRGTINGTDKSREIVVNVGKLPLIIFDFESDEINEKWVPSGVNGGTTTLSVIHRDSGEPVRFGNHSLRMDFDFSKATRMPSGSYAGFTDIDALEALGVTLKLPGSPAGVGMWIYATEEVQGVWLRSGIGVEGNTNWKAFDLSEEIKGIDWLGWKYVELDLTDFSGPYTILPGQFIRLMITANSFGGIQGTYPVGSIYIDDITVTYGHNPEDTFAPVIDSVKINNNEISEGHTIGTNLALIETSFYDQENNSAGLDYDNVNIYVDGINYVNKDGYLVDVTGEKAYLQNVKLSDGFHEIKVVVIDNAGNETEERRYVEVNTGRQNKVYLQHDEKAIVGKDYVLALKADEIDDIDSIYTSLEISNNISNFEVDFSEAFEGEIEYLGGLRILNIKARRVSETTVENVFKIKFPIDSSYSASTVISHRVNIGSVDYDVEKDFLYSFSDLPRRFGVEAPLQISHETILVGSSARFSVKDVENKAVEGAEVILVDSEGEKKLGETDSSGIFSTELFSSVPTSFVVYAKLGDEFSFELAGQSFGSSGGEAGEPFNITANGMIDLAFSKNISWFSNTFSENKQALVQYALKSDYDLRGEDVFIEKSGTLVTMSFEGSSSTEENYVVDINNVQIDGLRSAQWYAYRVGNGDAWSEIRYFSTVPLLYDTKFLILGDIQTENYEGIENDLHNISTRASDFDFVVQVGDLVDNAGDFTNWNGVLSVLEESFISDLSTIHVLGNHEYYGDHTGDKAKTIFNLQDGREDVYSGVYGNLYFGVVNYTMDEDVLVSSLEWLVEDAKKSDADWKILFTHQPPYYSNPQGGSDIFHEILPSYVEEAGFDFVISGHDHVYARTKPLISGNVNDEGVVYLIAGALGEKRYTAVNRPEFNFEYMNDKFGSLYLTVAIQGDEFTIKAFETSTGEELDSYTKKKQVAAHEHEYRMSGDELICDACGLIIPVEGFTGFIKNEDCKTMYLIGGNVYKGMLVLTEDVYMFDEETGHAIVGDTEIWGLPSTFDNNGKLIAGGTGFIEREGNTFYYERLSMIKNWHDIGKDRYYFDNNTGVMYSEVQPIGNSTYVFALDGKFLDVAASGFHKNTNGTLYVSDSNKTVHGWQEIDGNTYYFASYRLGYMKTGFSTIDGILYEFTTNGKLVQEFAPGPGFRQHGSNTLYINKNGEILHGWQEIDGETYYFSKAGHGHMRTGTTIVEGVEYVFSVDGKLLSDSDMDFRKEEGGVFYGDNLNNRLHDWQEINGDTYYFSKAGHGYMRTGETIVEGKEYSFSEDGKLISDFITGFRQAGVNVFYVNEHGNILHGWQEINGDTYYFSKAGHGYMRTGVSNVEGEEYTFSDDGKLLSDLEKGFRKGPGGIFYVSEDGKIIHGWQEIDGNTYYFSQAGHGYMRTGTAIVEGVEYVFSVDGKLLSDSDMDFRKDEGGVFYGNNLNNRLHGWQVIDGNTYYFSQAGHGYMRTGQTTIEGVICKFTEGGILIEGLSPGFHKDDQGTFYVSEDSKILHGWHEIDDATYYFSQAGHGYMRTGKAEVAGVTYYFSEEGILQEAK